MTSGNAMHPMMCILDVGPDTGSLSLTALHTWIRSDRYAKPRAYAVVVVVCLALLALLTVIQVVHVHPVNTDADHCPLCIALHTAAPVAAAAAAVILVQLESLSPVLEVRRLGASRHRQIFIRPPPCVSVASF